jgi:hypothetical protein
MRDQTQTVHVGEGPSTVSVERGDVRVVLHFKSPLEALRAGRERLTGSLDVDWDHWEKEAGDRRTVRLSLSQ